VATISLASHSLGEGRLTVASFRLFKERP